jgi:catechol 2,3-dioxygenase-like lactoylglutathione lyase family enzyme
MYRYLNVADLDASIEFYSKLFKAEPAKVSDREVGVALADLGRTDDVRVIRDEIDRRIQALVAELL